MNWVADLRSGLESEIGRKYLEREKAWFMDRRHFCLQIAAAAGLLSESGRIVQACNTAHDDTLAATADVYALWSVLIPVIQIQPGKGYMIADEKLFRTDCRGPEQARRKRPWRKQPGFQNRQAMR